MRTSILFAVPACLALAAGAAAQHIASVAPGYEAILITGLPEPPTGGVAGDAVDITGFYITTGGFQDERVYRMTVTPPATFTFALVAAGTTNTASGPINGNDVLDNGFGSLGLVSLPDGRLFANENDRGAIAPGLVSEAVLVLEDGNGDGDFLDGNAGVAEARLFATPIATTAGNYTGAALAANAAGVLFAVTSDGAGNGEVLRLEPASPVPLQTVFFPGLSFGAGIAVDSLGRVIVGDTDFATVNRVLRLTDANSNNVATDAGEAETLTSTIDPPNSLSLSSIADGERIVVSTNGAVPAVVFLDPVSGTTTPLVTFEATEFATGLAFDRSNRSFMAGSANGQTLVISSFSFLDFETRLWLVQPQPLASVEGWALYD